MISNANGQKIKKSEHISVVVFSDLPQRKEEKMCAVKMYSI